ncbi:hypothetical protein BJY01DRAFT_85017 [Aspergillus pseudoustus]|uniref:FAD-binding PCMH-type domain-containing protein n=1 Tax=Aspergillus pseudoustus TaxID=1810923 RepID=A0ABR4J290_9EURO
MRPFLLSFFLTSLAYAHPHQSDCRCRPHQSCWPSPKEWDRFNRSVDGNLVAVRPVADVCHDAIESEACQLVQDLSWNSTWRAAQPGAVQWQNWEAWPERGESCYIETLNKPCGQGRISLYSTIATSAANIQETVRFAREHNLRLAIKNSGHCYLGRSTAPESLQIQTSHMKDISFVDDFTPKGAPRGRSEGSAVTIGAGVALQELYAALGEKGRIAVAGAAHTVGAAGGYVQGGGHSFLGPWKGMASDNALQFTVVTADGNLLVTNEYLNRDLFWALRGGGGGTFGVVVDVTLRTFDEAPVIISTLNISTPVGHPAFWDAITEFHAHLPALSDAGGAGYYRIFPDLPLPEENITVSGVTLALVFPNQTDVARVDQLFDSLLTKLNVTSAVTTEYASDPLPDIHTLISEILITSDADITGGMTLVGSRMYSRGLFENGPAKLSSVLRKIRAGPYEGFTGHIVSGGAVANTHVDSALHPAWRESLLHLTFGRGWDPETSLAEQNAIRDNVTNVEVELLRSVEGSHRMGAYLNEANAYEKDFQSSFWGSNYNLLYKIKQRWDPTGLFITRSGVGSEDWDAEGLCRIRSHRLRDIGSDDVSEL